MNLHEAAARLDVHYQTAYRWVRTGQLSAVKQGNSYTVSDQALNRLLAARSAPTPPPRAGRVRDWAVQAGRLHDALLGGDELGARQIVDRLRDQGIDPVDLVAGLLAPALYLVGEDWVAERCSVAVEHRATAICDRLLTRLAVHPRGRPRGVAVVATPPGEAHGLPAAMAAVALRADRWRVHHLGTEVPTVELGQLAAAVGADVVVLSVTFLQAKAEAETSAELLGRAGCRVLLGQPGVPVRDLVTQARGL